MEDWDVIIIGAGSAGLSAGIYAVRSGLKTLILDEKFSGGAISDASLVVNYPGFAEIAREEGFNSVAKIFESIAVAEKQHEKRYLGLLANVEAGTVFKKDKPVVWRCLNCGYLHEDEEAPKVCPACAHKQEHFELLGENW